MVNQVKRRRYFLPAAFLCAVASSVSAQTTSDLTLKPWPANSLAETLDTIVFQNKGDVRGEGQKAQVFWWDSFGRLHFDKQDPQSPAIGYRYLTIDFDTRSRVLPDTLDEISLAAGLHLGTIGGGDVTAVLGAGYSGDNLFADANGIFGVGHLTYERRLGGDDFASDSLVLTLDYNGNSAFLPDVPLPGFAVVHREEALTYALGFPASSLRWKISPELSLTLQYVVPYSGQAVLEYKLAEHWSVFAEFANFFNGFEQDGHSREDRVFYQMRRVDAGVRFADRQAFWGIGLDLAVVAGYAFDQDFSRGFDVRRLDHFAGISDEPYVGIVLRGWF